MDNFLCDDCGKAFETKESLDMHRSHKHGKDVKVKKDFKFGKKEKYWVVIIIAILIIGGIAYYISSRPVPNYDNLAKCLAEKNATMYGACWCPHCADQKKAFGTSFQYINYVECIQEPNGICPREGGGSQTSACTNASINGYPTWIFGDGKRLEGFTPLDQLAETAGCSLN